MADKQFQPRSIFECINQNIVDLSQDFVTLYAKVDAIYNALYPQPISEPNADGAESKE